MTSAETIPVPLRRNRDFVLLWSGAGLAFLAWRVGTLAYPLVALGISGAPASAGLVGFAATAAFVWQLPAGVLVDRYDRRRLMIVCEIGRAVVVGSMALTLLIGVGTIAQLAVVAFVEGSLSTCYRVAERAAVPHVVQPVQLTSALSGNEARERAAGLLGQPVGGVLYGLSSWLPFVGGALCYLASLGSLLLIKNDFRSGARRTNERMGVELAAGIRWLWRQPFLRLTTLLIAGSNLLFAMQTLSLIVLVDADGGAPVAGLVLGATGLGGALGALGARWCTQRIGVPMVVLATNWLWAPLVLLVAFVHAPAVLGLIGAATGAIGGVWSVAVAAYQLEVTPDAYQGRVLSAAFLCASVPVPLGALLGGSLLGSFGVHTTVLVVAAGMAALAVVSLASPGLRSALREKPTEDIEEMT